MDKPLDRRVRRTRRRLRDALNAPMIMNSILAQIINFSPALNLSSNPHAMKMERSAQIEGLLY